MKGVKKAVLPILFAAFVIYILWATVFSGQVRCTVCIEFRGETACRSALGEDRDQALKTAKENACAQLTSGMAQLTVCKQQEPVSIEWDEN